METRNSKSRLTFIHRRNHRRFIGWLPFVGALAAAIGFVSVSSAEAQTFAYVSNADRNTVSVIDTATNLVVATVPVGKLPIGLAATPDGSRVYVAALNSARVDVIDTTTNTLATSIPVSGGNATYVAIRPDGLRAYVGVGEQVQVIDTATNTIVATILLGGSQVAKLAVSPDGSRVYVPQSIGGVKVIDTATNTLIPPSIPMPSSARAVAFKPDGTQAYATSTDIRVIDTSTNMVVNTITGNSQHIVLSPDGSRAYATSGNSLLVIDTVANVPLPAIPLGSYARGLAITSDGSRIYVCHINSDEVSVVDTGTSSLVATIAGVLDPHDVAIVSPSSSSCIDVDEDGYGSPGGASCNNGAAEDCDDLDSSINPGVTEMCTGVDDNCDGALLVDEVDVDEDGFLICENDCDDTNYLVNPDAFEIPGNFVDEDCNGDVGACDPCFPWKNHGQYVRCVAQAVEDLVSGGFLTQDEGDVLVSNSAQTDIGKRGFVPSECP